MTKKLSVLALLLMLSVSISAQSEARATTRGDVLMSQARSSDRNQRLDLLRSFESGTIAVDEESLRALSVLAGSGTVFRDRRATVDFSDLRASALTILGNSGIEEARMVVVRTLDVETHPAVLASGFAALAVLGGGDDLVALRVMNDAMRRSMARDRSETVADDYLNALAVMVNSENPDMQTIDILTALSRGSGYSFHVRSRANEMLRSFW